MGDEGSILWQILLQVILILLNAVFACAEIAVISVNDKKLEKLSEKGDKRAGRLIKLTDQPARVLSVIQISITLSGFLGSAFAADNFAAKLTEFLIGIGLNISASALNTVSVIIITLVLSYFTLVFGELVPKRIAMRNSEKIALAMSGLMHVVSKIFAPIVWLLTASTNGLLRLIGIDPDADDEEVTEEEIRLMVDAGSENGSIDLEERDFIHNIFKLDDITAEEVMTHRTAVSLLWMDESIEEWEKTINESIHSIYPVCNEDVDDIIGTLNIKDYFRLKERTREAVIETCIKPAYLVPETVRGDVLLRNMKISRNHFAVIVDEYGGMSGIVTINDLLEQLVGNLDDDLTTPGKNPPIERIDSLTWKIYGSAPLDLVSEQLGIELPEEYDTFGGLVFGLLGSIPSDGDTPEVEGCGLNIKVTDIKDRCVVSALVCFTENAPVNVQA